MTTPTERKFAKIKEKVDRLKREADKAEGAYEELLRVLKRDFDCDNLDDAKELLERLIRQEQKLKAKLEKSMAAFKDKWDDQLREIR